MTVLPPTDQFGFVLANLNKKVVTALPIMQSFATHVDSLFERAETDEQEEFRKREARPAVRALGAPVSVRSRFSTCRTPEPGG